MSAVTKIEELIAPPDSGINFTGGFRLRCLFFVFLIIVNSPSDPESE